EPGGDDRERQADRESGQSEGEAATAERQQDVARGRAESHADADLVGAAGDGIGEDAVETDRGEQQSEERERAEESRALGGRRYLAVDDLLEGADVGQGLIGVDRPDRLLDR